MRSRRLSPTQTRARLAVLGVNRRERGAFAFEEDAARIGYDFHSHPRHQLLYAMSGVARLESETSQFLLPPQRAAWIPARVRHATDVSGAKLLSIYLEHPGQLPTDGVHVFDVPALVREMLLYARRFPQSRVSARGHDARDFFRALTLVLADVARTRPAYALPRARSETTARAMAWVLAHLMRPTLGGAARHAGTTPRTLRRHLLAETGISFRAFVNQARIQRAMQLLIASSQSLVQIALDVGFQSQSAFTQAFRKSTGTTPRAFRVER